MEIIEEDFKLTPVSDDTPLFDLELLQEIGGKNARSEFKQAAYGISIGYAIKIIAHYRVCKNKKEEAIKLIDYLQDYKKQFNSLKSLCGI